MIRNRIPMVFIPFKDGLEQSMALTKTTPVYYVNSTLYYFYAIFGLERLTAKRVLRKVKLPTNKYLALRLIGAYEQV